MTPVQEYAQRTLSYIEQDLVTFDAVVATPSFRGKIGVAMITNACAALDLFAWLLYQRFDLTIKNHDLFKRLVSDTRFFDQGAFINPKVLYGIVRCGVVHQFYPKCIGIVALARDEPFLNENGEPRVNALGLYRTVVAGLKKVRAHIMTASGTTLADLDTRFELRGKIDREALDGAKLDPALLPPM
jgi:hypothetical protein